MNNNKHDKLSCFKGKIISGFVQTEFLISEIVYNLKLIKGSRFHFFANSKTESKILNLIKLFEDSDIIDKYEYINLLKKFNEIRDERNNITHSITLGNIENEDELITYNYLLQKKNLVREIGRYQYSDFEKFNSQIISIHNDFYNLYYKSKI